MRALMLAVSFFAGIQVVAASEPVDLMDKSRRLQVEHKEDVDVRLGGSALESHRSAHLTLQKLYHPGHSGSYFDWGTGQNGWGYCYEWASNGEVLNGGRPVGNWLCERENPSYFYWGQAVNGWGYCYQWTPYGVAMNEGRPMANRQCEVENPSYFAWARAQNGYFYCYQWTSNGYVMNEGRPVHNSYCR